VDIFGGIDGWMGGSMDRRTGGPTDEFMDGWNGLTDILHMSGFSGGIMY
jgi:hypothetical protein